MECASDHRPQTRELLVLMTELLDLLMTLAFLCVWVIVASDLIGRHGRDSGLRPAGDYRRNGSRRF